MNNAYVPNATRLAKVLAIDKAFQSIKVQFVGVAAPPRIKLRDELKLILVGAGLIDLRRVKPSRMGVNMKNRFGQGVVPARAHKLLSDIYGEGFSLTELDLPWAVETPPVSCTEYAEILAWNQNICALSGGFLPQYADGIEATSLSCTNTNPSCRIMLQTAPSDNKELTENGLLSLERLAKKDPLYAQHCTDGLTWSLIPYEVEYLHPWVPELFQEAGNTAQAYTEASTRFEVMLSILKIAQRTSKDPNAPSGDAFWEKIQLEAERGGRVPFADEVVHFVRFLKKLCGGIENPHLFMEYWSFLLTLKSKPKNIMGPIYSAIADVTIGTPDACPHFRIACMMAMSAASPTYSRGNEQILLDVNEIKTLGNKNAVHATIAEDMIVKAMAMSKEHRDLRENDTAIKCASYMLLLRLVHHVLKKPDDSRGKFDDMEAIGHKFVCELVSIVGVAIHSPWARAVQSPPARTTKSSNVGVAVFTGDKVSNAAELLADKRFEVGQHVTGKSVEGTWRIMSIDTQVHLECDALDLHFDIHKFSSAVEKHEWKLAKVKGAVEPLENWLANANPLESIEFESSCAQSRMILALQATQKRFGCVDGVDPLVDATGKLKDVAANRKFAPNTLVLVPLTDSTVFRTAKEKCSGVRTSTKVKDPRDHSAPEKHLWLQKKEVMATNRDGARDRGFVERTSGPAFIAPYWLVGDESDQKLVNMVATTKEVTITVDDQAFRMVVPCLQNPRTLKPGAKLRKATPKSIATSAGQKRKSDASS